MFYALVTMLLSALAADSANAQQQIKLESMSDQGTFKVEMIWTPADIGSDNTFSIRFIEPETGIEMEEMEYNLLLYHGDGVQKLRRVDQIATQQKLNFEEIGSYTIKIDDIEGLGEGATFSIQVTPEFPAGIIAVVAAAVGAIIFAGRINSKNLFRL